MKAELWKRVKLILALAILAYLVYFVLGRRDLFSSFFARNTTMMVAVTGGILLQNLLQAGLVKPLVKAVGLELPLAKALALGFLSGTAGTLLPLQAGIGVRGLYLKKVHGLSYTSVVVSALVNNLTKLITCAAIALLALFFAGTSARIGLLLLLLLPALAIPPALFLLAQLPLERIPSRRLRAILAEFGQAWRSARSDRRNLTAIFLIQFAIMAVNGAVFYGMFLCLGEKMPFFLLTAYTALKFLAGLAALLPANIGVSEVITGVFADLAALPFQAGVMAALIVRLISTAILLIGAAAATVSGALER